MRTARWSALTAYAALILLVLVWEAWWAPATPVPRSFWIALKVVPLIIPLAWLVRGNAYAHVLASLLLLIYLSEGAAVGYDAIKSNAAGMLLYAMAEVGLVLSFVGAAAIFARLSFQTKTSRAAARKEW